MKSTIRVTASIAVCAVLAASSSNAATITVQSYVTEDHAYITAGNFDNPLNRNEGFVGAERFVSSRFDAAILAVQDFTDPSQFTLTGATLTVREQSSRNTSINGTQDATFNAYFYSTAENSEWSQATPATLIGGSAGPDSGTPGDGWFGLNAGRSGDDGNGADNVDPRFSIASGDITFTTASDDDTLVIDLTQGGTSLASIQSILADWVAGDNAGIGLSGVASGGTQVAFTQNNIFAGNPVGSNIDGDPTGAGLSTDFEGGTAIPANNGGVGGADADGGAFLTLTFEPIPEPGTVALSMLALAGIGAVGMRTRLG